MERKGISLDVDLLEERLKTKATLVSARKNTGIDELKEAIINYRYISDQPCVNASIIAPEYFDRLRKAFPHQSLYKLWLVITQDVNFGNINRNEISSSDLFETKSHTELKQLQHKETILRYQFINGVLKETMKVDANSAKDLRSRLDRVLTHKVWGYAIFLVFFY